MSIWHIWHYCMNTNMFSLGMHSVIVVLCNVAVPDLQYAVYFG